MSEQTPSTPKSDPQSGPQKAAEILKEELVNGATGGKQSGETKGRSWASGLVVPVLAIFTGLVIGGLLIIFTDLKFYEAWRQSPGAGLRAAWDILVTSYSSLFTGAFGDPARIVAAIQSGDGAAIRKAFYPFFESLVATTPYIFGGLSVALGFRAGVFNIGAEGQLFIGASFAAGASFPDG